MVDKIKGQTETVCPFCTILNLNFTNVDPFGLKFGKAQQKIVTFVATALKTHCSVAETYVRFSRRKLYTRNVNCLFGVLHIFVHIYSYSI